MAFETDVLVVGAGPAGLVAAAGAARAGAEVIVADEQRIVGGGLACLGRVPLEGDEGPRPAADLRRTLQAGAEAAGAILLTEALVWGVFDGPSAAVLTPAENLEVRPKILVIAAGAVDRPVPFPGWTLPTVVNAQDALRLVHVLDAPLGRRAVVASAGGVGVPVALALQEAGLEVLALAEAGTLTDAEQAALSAARVPALRSAQVQRAHGQEYVRRVDLSTPEGLHEINADILVLATGRSPLAELCWIAGCQMRWDPARGGWVPERSPLLETSVPGVFVAGAAAGVCGLRTALAEGRLAGAAAAAALGLADRRQLEVHVAAASQACAGDVRTAREMEAQWLLEGRAVELALQDPETVLCRCEEVTMAAVRQAVEDGATTPAEVKRMTRVGMGECQGRACRGLLSRVMSQMLSLRVEELTPLTYRPPVRPLPLEALLRGSNEPRSV
jgi:thioredoxin reductase/bacterioferritin-associated ferredoxin